MFVDLTPEQRALQAELRQYFSSLISPEEANEMETDRHGKAYRAVIRRMGQDGKLGVGWPREFGGHGFGPIEQQIFVNEAARADVPLPAVTLQTVGPTLQKYGSEAQMTKFLPAILAGEVHFAIGYSEPDAGTDLASLRTTAVRQGDEYIVNGQKIFTTGAHDADYIWLACRTDPEAVKHKGISILIVDTTFTMDSNTEIAVARAAGIGELKFFSKIHYGGGAACATIQQAAMAVATGVADVVVAYRAFNERSGMRFGQVQTRLTENADATGVDNSFSYPHGLSTPAAQVAMIAKRYMHLSGATSRDFGAISVADRKHAAKNPKAYFYEKPITIEDHQNSRWIAEPLRLLDCCQETDGAVAIVVTSPARARDLNHRPAVIEAAAQGSSPDQCTMVSYYRPELDGLPEMGLVGKQLWSQSGLEPTDIQTAVLYDHFTPSTLIQVEELGFCGWGEAKDFIADGAIELGGRLPINTHGGQLGEAYIHGMNGIAEGVRQLRGTSVNEVPDVEHVLITAGTGVPTSGLILG